MKSKKGRFFFHNWRSIYKNPNKEWEKFSLKSANWSNFDIFWFRLFIGYMDFMGAVLIGIMSFFSTRSILFDISFFFRSISRINSGAKVIGGAIWFNLQWWMYMVVWAAFLDIGRVFILIYIIFLDIRTTNRNPQFFANLLFEYWLFIKFLRTPQNLKKSSSYFWQ